jgi:hypothetical protein
VRPAERELRLREIEAGPDPSEIGGAAEAPAAPSARSRLEILDLADLLERHLDGRDQTFLIEGIWPADAYGILGAEDKAGKTWAIADLAVSVATGTPWLGRYACEPGPVLLLFGEGGARNLYRRLDAICRGRGIILADLFEPGLVRTSLAVPRLTRHEDLEAVTAELVEHAPRLLLLDPGYLALAGVRGADLFAMGDALGAIQSACQSVEAALIVSWHWNKTGEGAGAQRFTGVGPGAWGRVLGSAAKVQSHTEDDGASVVELRWDFTGGEIADTSFRMRRRVWAEDPSDLLSPMHYEVEVLEEPPAGESDLTYAQERVLAVIGEEAVTVKEIGDRLAIDGRGRPLKVRTIQRALRALADRHLVDGEEGDSVTDPGRWWRS